MTSSFSVTLANKGQQPVYYQLYSWTNGPLEHEWSSNYEKKYSEVAVTSITRLNSKTSQVEKAPQHKQMIDKTQSASSILLGHQQYSQWHPAVRMAATIEDIKGTKQIVTGLPSKTSYSVVFDYPSTQVIGPVKIGGYVTLPRYVRLVPRSRIATKWIRLPSNNRYFY